MKFALVLLLVLVAVPVQAQDKAGASTDKASVALTITYAALVGADVGASVSCIQRGTCQEANPAYRWIDDGAAFGAARAAVGAVTVYAVHRVTKPRTWQRYTALGALVVIQGLVVAHGRQF